MNDPDWRAQLRDAGIARRPPPSSRAPVTADRGHVEQPGESGPPKSAPPVSTPPVSTPPIARRVVVEVPKSEPAPYRGPTSDRFYDRLAPGAPSPPTPSPPRMQQQALPEPMPMPRPEPLPEPAKPSLRSDSSSALVPFVSPPASPAPLSARENMPPKKSDRRTFSQEFREKAVALVLADPTGGSQARVCKKLGLTASLLSRWVQLAQGGQGIFAESQTLLSRPAPPSAPVSNGKAQTAMVPPRSQVQSSAAPPAIAVPTVTLNGLEDYINAIVDRRVAEFMRQRFG